MQAELIIASGSHKGQAIKVDRDSFVIGRSSSANLRIKSTSVSRKHCEIVIRDDKLYARDLGSRNGTLVDGRKLPEMKRCRLKNGHELQVGKMALLVRIDNALASPSIDELLQPDKLEAATRDQDTHEQDDHRDDDPMKDSLSLDGIDLTAWGSGSTDSKSREDAELDKFAKQRTEASERVPSDKASKSEASETVEFDTRDTDNSLGLTEEEERRRILSSMRNQKLATSQDAASEAIRRMLGGNSNT